MKDLHDGTGEISLCFVFAFGLGVLPTNPHCFYDINAEQVLRVVKCFVEIRKGRICFTAQDLSGDNSHMWRTLEPGSNMSGVARARLLSDTAASPGEVHSNDHALPLLEA